MKIPRLFYIFSSIVIAIGLLVLLLTSLSPAAASNESPKSISTPRENNVSDRWRILADMQYGRGDPGVVALNNKIHAMSGYFSEFFGYSSSQELYDPQTNMWNTVWDFPNPRSAMVAVTVDGKIYAIGGWIDPDSQGDNHMYDPVSSTWITKTSMITPVSDAGGVVISDTIYVIGGYDSISISDTRHVQVYNTVSDTWSIGTPMSVTRSGFGAVVVDGLIYAVGGTHDANNVELYDPVLDVWTSGPPLPETRFSMAVAERKGDIYVIGGSDQPNGTVTNTTLIFSPTFGSWTSGSPMPTARRDSRAAVISDTIYVIGGVGPPGAGKANEAFGDFEIISSTTSILSDDPDPSQAFQPFLLSYIVTPTGIAPTGIVTVTVGQSDVQCSELLVAGTGSCEIALDTPGFYTITADYAGDSFYSSSSDQEDHIVVKAATTTTVSGFAPDPSLPGQAFAVSFSVTSTYGIPTGTVTVTVSDSPQNCTSGLTNGLGSCEITLDVAGTYTVTASYPGDINFAPSSDNIGHVVEEGMLQLFVPLVLREG